MVSALVSVDSASTTASSLRLMQVYATCMICCSSGWYVSRSSRPEAGGCGTSTDSTRRACRRGGQALCAGPGLVWTPRLGLESVRTEDRGWQR